MRALQPLRGIDQVGPIGLVAEIGDIGRLAHPRQLMAYLGLVPSEHSSGERMVRGTILIVRDIADGFGGVVRTTAVQRHHPRWPAAPRLVEIQHGFVAGGRAATRHQRFECFLEQLGQVVCLQRAITARLLGGGQKQATLRSVTKLSSRTRGRTTSRTL